MPSSQWRAQGRGVSIPGGTGLLCGESLCLVGSLQSTARTLGVRGYQKPQEEPILGEGSGSNFVP